MSAPAIEAIFEAKRAEVARLRADMSWSRRARMRTRHSFRAALARPGLSVIAEVKRSSPSTGPLLNDVDALLEAYIAAEVDALSVLTDAHFGMSAVDLERLAARTDKSILRKDFTLSKEQILEADLIGADAILLIAAFLSSEELRDLGAYAASLGLDVLYEVHAAEELAKIPETAAIVGVNNRNLAAGDYRTDTALSRDLLASIPLGALRVAESGYERAGDVPPGYDAVLIGTGLIRAFTRGGAAAVKSALGK